MVREVLEKLWDDKSKAYALKTVEQYGEFIGKPIEAPKIRVYDDREMFVPSPEMVRRLIHRVRDVEVKAQCLIAVETGACESEIHQLTVRDVDFDQRRITIRGVKGHRTWSYPISEELTHLLSLIISRKRLGLNDRLWKVNHPVNIGRNIRQYRKILYLETGNPAWLKLTFHSLRHFAISWFYFKTKDIVAAQRFARHCNIQNTLRYVHIVKEWIRENEYHVVYAETKEELTKYLSEGYELVAKTEWGYCMRKPKMIFGSP
ncbi:MAG: site-specific integrase [Candidatus Parvarchaeota archaeon]|nr:site-specific integrase [Candidatus Haiyanarchaeum thermophilum]